MNRGNCRHECVGNSCFILLEAQQSGHPHLLSYKNLKTLSITRTVFAPGFLNHVDGRPALEYIQPALRKRMIEVLRVDQLELQVNHKYKFNQLERNLNSMVKLAILFFLPLLRS